MNAGIRCGLHLAFPGSESVRYPERELTPKQVWSLGLNKPSNSRHDLSNTGSMSHANSMDSISCAISHVSCSCSASCCAVSSSTLCKKYSFYTKKFAVSFYKSTQVFDSCIFSSIWTKHLPSTTVCNN